MQTRWKFLVTGYQQVNNSSHHQRLEGTVIGHPFKLPELLLEWQKHYSSFQVFHYHTLSFDGNVPDDTPAAIVPGKFTAKPTVRSPQRWRYPKKEQGK